MADATTIRQIAERHVELLARRPDRGLLTCRTRARRAVGLRNLDQLRPAAAHGAARSRTIYISKGLHVDMARKD